MSDEQLAALNKLRDEGIRVLYKVQNEDASVTAFTLVSYAGGADPTSRDGFAGGLHVAQDRVAISGAVTKLGTASYTLKEIES